MRGLEWWNRFNLAFRYGNPVKFVSPQCNWFFQPFSFIIYRICLAIYMVTWLVLVILYWGEEPYYPKSSPVLERQTRKSLRFLMKCMRYGPCKSKTVHVHQMCLWQLKGILKLKKNNFCIILNNIVTICLESQAVTLQIAYTECVTTHVRINFILLHYIFTVTSTKCATEKRKTSPSPCLLPWYLRLQWFLQTIAYGATPPLVSAYWQEEHRLGFDEYNWTAFNMHVHGINYLILLIDTILVATPVKFAHCIYLSMYGFTYLIFTAVYFIAGGTDPYGEQYIYARWMNWAEDPLRAAVASFFGIVIILPLSQIVFVIMTYIRAFLSNKLGCNPQVDNECACDKDML
ncbi:uncharacterized protein [Antedon mediterranea]|uniref:uncharacterized protein n=1 Tax=Antedon mediterranea TaxID=105859 RepID=UPI003AF6F5B0